MKFSTPEKIPQGSKNYLKLVNGESVVGVFRGDPEIYYQIFENGKYQVVPSTQAGGQFRFSINFITKDGNNLVSKLFQGNWHDYEALKSLNEEFDLENTYIKVSQTGERQTKRISFMPMTKQKPDAKQLAAVPLQEMKAKAKAPTVYDSDPGPEADESSFDDEPLPF